MRSASAKGKQHNLGHMPHKYAVCIKKLFGTTLLSKNEQNYQNQKSGPPNEEIFCSVNTSF